MRCLILSLTLAAAVSGCAPSGLPSGDTVALRGAWGGPRVGLVLSDSGGTIEYDCGHGGFSVPLKLDGTGRFAISGVHVREHGGPARIGEVPDSLPARYVGQVSGNTMTLRVYAGADTLGPFGLRRDAPPQLVKCL